MRKWIGVICVLLGTACLFGAVGILIYNRWEDGNAEVVAHALLEDVKNIIDEKQSERPSSDESSALPRENNSAEEMPTEMARIQADSYECIGILSIPALDLQLPVLTPWSYAKLKSAPCHYYGSYYEKDFVIAGHNYQSHFGRLSELQAGDIVSFTDVNGEAHYYEVVLLETLPKEATQEMIASGFALSLYTCTPSGADRVTVRCIAVSDRN